ncbi:MAG: phenylalanine--tRNA ligase subunit beta [Thiomargarita sp.]|nr:phenylalanine--tRNA ligase subunit beta [Thiomargarita sp.]
MKFSEKWLREWVNPPISTEELVEQLTMAGLEVDKIEPVAIDFDKVVIGEIVSIKKHPDAKKLNICQVNIGKETLKIVCGANNVRPNMRVATALIGAKLGELEIKKSKLRNVNSLGMLCSAEELGLEEQSEGIMVLPNNAPIGDDLRQYLELEDVSIEIDLTPNRNDCLSIGGIAREVGVLTGVEVTTPNISSVSHLISNTFPIEVQVPQVCPRYVGRVIKDVDASVTTPIKIQERLRRSGIRSINIIVDITNYVLLELGQPMHAFDLERLTGGIQVRMARNSEALTLLNGQTVEMDDQTLVIADHQKPIAMAGVMGGQKTAVTETTQDIFLESAFFTPEQATGCARRYGLHTDSSHRFERGVDPQLQQSAIERATRLIVEVAGGQPGIVTNIVNETNLPSVAVIKLRRSRIRKVLGRKMRLRQRRIEYILTRLGMRFEHDVRMYHKRTGEVLHYPIFEGWKVTAPSFRFDINYEVDLIEEIARIVGYNNLPSQSLPVRLNIYPKPELTVEQIQTTLVQRDYQEAITYSFVDANMQNQINPDKANVAVSLANPIASDMSVMRNTLWVGLLQALIHNQKRQQNRVRLFETGIQFIQTETEEKLVLEEPIVAGIVSNTRFPLQWGEKEQAVDFFDVKADVETLLDLSNIDYHFVADNHPALHPGQTAAIYCGEEKIGLLGALHPNLMQTFELIAPVYLFELQLNALCQYKVPQFKEISKYPSMRRDIAVVVSEKVTASQLLQCIKNSDINSLVDIQLFDVYQGEGIESTKKSIAIGLMFQDHTRNLIDSEVDVLVEKILNVLEQTLEAQLRK